MTTTKTAAEKAAEKKTADEAAAAEKKAAEQAAADKEQAAPGPGTKGPEHEKNGASDTDIPTQIHQTTPQSHDNGNTDEFLNQLSADLRAGRQ